MQKKSNIVLLGMPGSGKSTVGVLLAKRLGMRFVDTDLLIQEQEDRLLNEIIRQEGLDKFIQIENQVNASLVAEKSVIAPGGSVIYGKEAMEHFKEIAEIVYLKLSYRSLAKRLGDLTKRGVVFRPGQTLKELYKERCPLYEAYADYVVECDGKDIGETLDKVREKIGK
ncbi:MAG: shikimate kinase [Lachnospiraceae bacterium]|nr:shikimate kinase [Lachnospiraceae bacterium]